MSRTPHNTHKSTAGSTLGFDDGIDKFFLEFSSAEAKETWATRIEELQEALFKQRQATRAEASPAAQEAAPEAQDSEVQELKARLQFTRAQTEELVRQLQKVSTQRLQKFCGSARPPANLQNALTPAKRCLLLISGESYTGKTTLTAAVATKLTLLERYCAIVPLASFGDKLQCHLRGEKEAQASGAVKLVAKVLEGLCENDQKQDRLHVAIVDGPIASKETANVYRQTAEWLGMTPVFVCCVAPCIDLEQRKRDLSGVAPIVAHNSFMPDGAVVVDTAEPVRTCVSVVFDAIRFSMAAHAQD